MPLQWLVVVLSFFLSLLNNIYSLWKQNNVNEKIIKNNYICCFTDLWYQRKGFVNIRKTHKEMYELTSSCFLSEVILGWLMSGEIPGRWQLVRREKTLVEKSFGQASWMWIRPLCVKNINRKLARNTQYVFVYIHSKRFYLMTKKKSKRKKVER